MNFYEFHTSKPILWIKSVVLNSADFQGSFPKAHKPIGHGTRFTYLKFVDALMTEKGNGGNISIYWIKKVSENYIFPSKKYKTGYFHYKRYPIFSKL